MLERDRRYKLGAAGPQIEIDVASGAINAGVKARQGRGGKVLVDPVAVPFVLRGNSDGHCIAIVDLSADKADAVAKQFSDADVSLQPAPAQILARAAGSCVTRRH